MNKKAFTLIELLVVVAIIGILAAVGVVAYNGYTASAKKSTCKQNSNFFKKEILRKWTNAQLQISEDIEFNGGYCYLHWLPSNAHLGNKGSNIKLHINANSSIPMHCNSAPQGQEHTIHDHFYGMGYRNLLLGNFAQSQAKPALDTPSRGNVLREGGSHFACGANAGLSDPYTCKLRTMCELNEVVEEILIKDN